MSSSSARSLRSEIICGIVGRKQHNGGQEVDLSLPPHLKPAPRFTRQRRPSCLSTYSLSASSDLTRIRRGSVPREEIPTTPRKSHKHVSRFRLKSKSLDQGVPVNRLKLYSPSHRQGAYRSYESLIARGAKREVFGSELHVDNREDIADKGKYIADEGKNIVDEGKDIITGSQEKIVNEVFQEKLDVEELINRTDEEGLHVKTDLEGLQHKTDVLGLQESLVKNTPQEKPELIKSKKKLRSKTQGGHYDDKSYSKSGTTKVEEKANDESKKTAKLEKHQKKLEVRKLSRTGTKGSHRTRKSAKIQEFPKSEGYPVSKISNESKYLSKPHTNKEEHQEKVKVIESKEELQGVQKEKLQEREQKGELQKEQKDKTLEKPKEVEEEEQIEETVKESNEATQKEQKEEITENLKEVVENKQGKDTAEASKETAKEKQREETVEVSHEATDDKQRKETAEVSAEAVEDRQRKETAEVSPEAAEDKQRKETAEVTQEAAEDKQIEETINESKEEAEDKLREETAESREEEDKQKEKTVESKEETEDKQKEETAEESKEDIENKQREETEKESKDTSETKQREETTEVSKETTQEKESGPIVEKSREAVQEELKGETKEDPKEAEEDFKAATQEEQTEEAVVAYNEVAQEGQGQETTEKSKEAAEKKGREETAEKSIDTTQEDQRQQTLEESKEAVQEKKEEEAEESKEAAQEHIEEIAEVSKEGKQRVEGGETSEKSKETPQKEKTKEDSKKTVKDNRENKPKVFKRKSKVSPNKEKVNKPSELEENIQTSPRADGLHEKLNAEVYQEEEKVEKTHDGLGISEPKADKTDGEIPKSGPHRELKAKKVKVKKTKKPKALGADVSNEAEVNSGKNLTPKKTAKKLSASIGDSDGITKTVKDKEESASKQSTALNALPPISVTDPNDIHTLNFELIFQENNLGPHDWTASHAKLYYPKKKRRVVRRTPKKEYNSDEDINIDLKGMDNSDEWSNNHYLGRHPASRYAGHSRLQYRSIGNELSTTGYCPRCDPNAEKKPKRVKRRIFKSASLNNLSSTQDDADDEGGEKKKRGPFNGLEEKRYKALMDEIQTLMDEVQKQRNEFRNELRVLASCLENNRQHQEGEDSKTEEELAETPLDETDEKMSSQEAPNEVKEEVKEEKPEDGVNADTKEDEKEEKKEESKEEGGSETPSTSATPEPGSQENGDDAPGTPKQLTLREQFRNFSKFGDTKSDGKMLTLSQSDKWFKQAKVIDGKTITTTDTAITFNKLKSKKITFVEFEKYLDEISKAKKLDAKEIKAKLRDCGAPGFSGTTSVVKNSAIDRLTDTKKFTGSHKLRFDSTGRGRGIAGRRDLNDGAGYVTGYKNKNTYDKTH